MFPDRIFDINVMRLGCVSIVIQMWATFMEKLWVFMRSLGNVSVHSILETFPLCSLLREIFVILFFVNSGAVFGLASVTFLRCCPIEVCELRASAFDVSAHDSRLFLSRDWGPGYGSWLGSDGKPWVGSLYSVPWLDTSLLVSLFALKDSKWVALIFWEKTKQNENRRVALGARMLTLDLTSFYFKFMLVIDFAKSSEGEFVREDIQCKRSPCRLFIVVITVQDHTCVFLDTETGQYLRELTMEEA